MLQVLLLETEWKKHGERDYRLDAVIPISGLCFRLYCAPSCFEIIHAYGRKYDRDADLSMNIPSIPLELWKWGYATSCGSLRNGWTKNNYESPYYRVVRYRYSIWCKYAGLYHTCAELYARGGCTVVQKFSDQNHFSGLRARVSRYNLFISQTGTSLLRHVV